MRVILESKKKSVERIVKKKPKGYPKYSEKSVYWEFG